MKPLTDEEVDALEVISARAIEAHRRGDRDGYRREITREAYALGHRAGMMKAAEIAIQKWDPSMTGYRAGAMVADDIRTAAGGQHDQG